MYVGGVQTLSARIVVHVYCLFGFWLGLSDKLVEMKLNAYTLSLFVIHAHSVSLFLSYILTQSLSLSQIITPSHTLMFTLVPTYIQFLILDHINLPKHSFIA